MLKKHKIDAVIGACILSSIVLINNESFFTISYAREEESKSKTTDNNLVMEKVIEGYDILNTYNNEFANYLLKKGISKSDYKECVKYISEHKDNKIALFYEIENLLYSFDTIMYTDKTVRSMYKNNLEEFKNKDIAWGETVKSLIYDPGWVSEIYSKNIDKELDIEKLYRYKFGREMTKKEMEYAKNPKNLIYILYSGVLGRDIEESEVKLINKGKGYELLGVTSEEHLEYQKIMSKIKKILDVSVRYIKSYEIHNQARKSIINKYKIDIFAELTEDDRESVYMKSLDNYIYRTKLAEKIFVAILTGREHISDGDSGNENGGVDEKPPITGDSSINTPVDENGKEDLDGSEEDEIAKDDGLSDEDYEYLEEVLKPLGSQVGQIIHSLKANKYTTSYYSKLGEMLDIYNSNENKRVLVVEVGEAKIYTLVEVKNNEIASSDFATVMNQIVVEGLGKLVESKQEMLLFVNNSIATIEKKDDNYKIGEINESMKTASVVWRIDSLQDVISEYMKEMYEEVMEVEESEE